ncbi:MAG: FAD:protein FMN transferase [Bacillota bacterium]
MSDKNKDHACRKKAILKCRFLRLHYFIPVILLGIIVYFFMQDRLSDKLYVMRRLTMDTYVEVRLTDGVSESAEEIGEKIFAEIERLELFFSRSIENSDIVMINSSAGLHPVQVSEEVFYVTERAVDFAILSNGTFDPTIAPLVDCWGFLGQEYRVPSENELANSIGLVDYTRIELDKELSAIYLPDTGMSMELGGIAKGFIVDRALQILREAGVQNAYINAGGDIGLIGSNRGGKPWMIGVRHPRDDHEVIAVLPVSGGAVVTSGDYERAFEEGGVTYHHILNPRNGMPAVDLISVTIISETVIEADVLSTAVFVLGPVDGMALIEELPGIEGILITPDLDILVSFGLEGIVELNP